MLEHPCVHPPGARSLQARPATQRHGCMCFLYVAAGQLSTKFAFVFGMYTRRRYSAERARLFAGIVLLQPWRALLS